MILAIGGSLRGDLPTRLHRRAERIELSVFREHLLRKWENTVQQIVEIRMCHRSGLTECG